jgi:hypothetical protein
MKMQQRTEVIVSLLLIALFAFLLAVSGCGGGEGGGVDNVDGGVAPATIESTTAPQIASGLGNILASTEFATTAISLNTGSGLYCPKTLLRHVDRLWTRQDVATPGTVQLLGADSATNPCTDGGTVSINVTWDGPDNPQDCTEMRNVDMEFVFSDCREDMGTLNGTMGLYVPGDSCTDTPSAFDISFTNFRYQNPPDGSDFTINFTMVFSSPQYDMNDYLVGGTVLFNGSMSGSLEGTSMNVTFHALNFAMAGMVYDVFDDIVEATFTINGSMSGNIDGDQFSERYRNLVVRYEQIVQGADNGKEFTVNGDYAVGCLSGWTTVETLVPLFRPDGGNCPASGEIRFSGDGEATIEYHSDGSLTIYVDGDTLDYVSCDGLPACI